MSLRLAHRHTANVAFIIHRIHLTCRAFKLMDCKRKGFCSFPVLHASRAIQRRFATWNRKRFNRQKLVLGEKCKQSFAKPIFNHDVLHWVTSRLNKICWGMKDSFKSVLLRLSHTRWLVHAHTGHGRIPHGGHAPQINPSKWEKAFWCQLQNYFYFSESAGPEGQQRQTFSSHVIHPSWPS